MGTCGHSLIIRDLYMYNLKVYTSNIYVVNYGDTVANHGSVYRPCLNYQKEEWVLFYTHTHTQKYINWKSNVPMVTKTGSKTLIFRAYMIHAQKSKIAMRNGNF